MKPTFRELENALEIDRSDLHTEALHYPMMFYHAARGLAQAEADVNDMKLELEEIESDLGRQAVDELPGKVTNAQKLDYVKDQPKWQRERQRYLNARKEAAKWQALVDAWRQKSYQIRVLADLHIHEYESNDVGAGTRKARRAIREASSHRVRRR